VTSASRLPKLADAAQRVKVSGNVNTGARRLRIVVGDDHALVLKGIKALLESEFEVVGTASDGRALVETVLHLKPDLVVLDVSMPEMNGIEAARLIHEALPSVRLVFLSMHTNPLYLRRAFESGGEGYVLKAGASEELLTAIRRVLGGEVYLSPGFGHDMQEKLEFGIPRKQDGELTSRQREILLLIAEGRFSKEIAHILNISIKTVDFHRARLMTRLGVHSVAELIRRAIEEGLVPASIEERQPTQSEPQH